MGDEVGISFYDLADIRRLVEKGSTDFLPEEPGFGHGGESVQFFAAVRQHISRDHSDARRIKTTRDGRAWHTTATQPCSYCTIELLLKRFDILGIGLEPDVSDIFRVPEPIFREDRAARPDEATGKNAINMLIIRVLDV